MRHAGVLRAVGAAHTSLDRAHGDAQPAAGALAQEQPVVRPAAAALSMQP
jgi:hypothetical protein